MSDLGNKEIFAKNLNNYMSKHNIDRYRLCVDLGFKYSTVSEWLSAKKYPRIDKIEMLANYFNIQKSNLIEEQYKNKSIITPFPTPGTTEDYTTFPVIGEVAAGYDMPALENWEGETVDIPNSYLKGREKTDFFALKVKGDSMYPMYIDGDIVFVLKQTTLNHSGQVGVVIYNDDCATLKKVEYVYGEDWMRLVPINPAVPPTLIEGEALEHCQVLGIPKLLIREIEE